MNDDLISRQDLMNTLHIKEDCQDCEYSSGIFCTQSPDFVNACEAICDAPSAEPRWIPVTERLPEEDYLTGANVQHSAEVLMTVCNTEGEETIIDYGRTVNGRWYSDITDCLVPVWWEVTAWMPLPQPWKGADDD